MRISHFSIWGPIFCALVLRARLWHWRDFGIGVGNIPNSDGKIGHVDGVDLFTQKAVCRFPLRATLGYRPVKSATIRHRAKAGLRSGHKTARANKALIASTLGRKIASCVHCCLPPVFVQCGPARRRTNPSAPGSRPSHHRPPGQFLRRRARREVGNTLSTLPAYASVRHHHRRSDVVRGQVPVGVVGVPITLDPRLLPDR